MDIFFLKFIIGQGFILAGAKNIWHSLIPFGDGSMKYRGGIKFTMISPEDNLKLSEFVCAQRKK